MQILWDAPTSHTIMSAYNLTNDDRSVGSYTSGTSAGSASSSSSSSLLLASPDFPVVFLTQHCDAPRSNKRKKTDDEAMPPPTSSSSSAAYPFMATLSTQQEHRPNRPRASSLPTIPEAGRSGGHRRSTTELVGPDAINIMRVSETHSSSE